MDSERLRDELIATAEHKLEKLRELINLSKEQQSILKDGMHEELAENVRKHDSVLLNLDKLARREEAITKLLAQEKARYDDDRLNAIRHETAEVAQRLRSLVAANTELLRNSLGYTRFSLELLSKLVTEQRAANEGEWNGALLLDKKV
ncbi:MAG: flagellar export chaperone FlgN [Armatimonadota bacterium]|nr:flagellar export chaperone FlgN [Armatimonadota bacterium]